MKRSAVQLRDEIALREASLADARSEARRGELSDAQVRVIEAREEAALARARAELDAHSERVVNPRRHRRALLVSALVCFALAAAVLAWTSLVPRQAGTSITGTVSLSRAQQVSQLLIEAEADVANADPVAALSAYRQVLAIDAKNVSALTQSGWLEFSAGSAAKSSSLVTLGVSQLRRAIALAPRNAAARLYYAIVASSTPGNGTLARRQLEIFLALHPSRAQLAIARPLLVHFKIPRS